MNVLLIDKLYRYFVSRNVLKEDEQAKLKYMLTVVINETLKLLIMFFLFYVIGKTLDFLICFLTLLIIRSFSGGFHIKSFWGCLLFTSLFFLASIYLPLLIKMNFTLSILLGIFSLATMATIAPIPSKQRGEYSKQMKLRFKWKSVIFTVVCFLIIVTTASSTPSFICMTWIFVLQSLQLIGTKVFHVLHLF